MDCAANIARIDLVFASKAKIRLNKPSKEFLSFLYTSEATNSVELSNFVGEAKLRS